MKNNWTKQPIKNFQKKKYYTNQNTFKNQELSKDNEPREIYFYDPLKREWGKRIIK